jgi:hypothetical protein
MVQGTVRIELMRPYTMGEITLSNTFEAPSPLLFSAKVFSALPLCTSEFACTPSASCTARSPQSVEFV